MVTALTTRALLQAFFRQKRKFFLSFGLVVGLGVAYVVTATPYYASTASVVVKFGADATPAVARQVLMREVARDERREIVASTIKLAESADLAEKLVEAVGVDRAFPGLGNAVKAGDSPQAAAARTFLKLLKVENERDTNVLDITVANPNPDMAREMAEKYIELFTQQQADVFGNPQTDFLKSQLEEAREQLARSQANLQSFKRETGISSVPDEIGIALQKRSDLMSQLASHQALAESARARQESLKASIAKLPKQVQTAVEDRFRNADDTQKRLQDLRDKEALLLQTYGENTPVVRSVRESIGAAQKELNQRMTETQSRTKPMPNDAYETLNGEYLRALAEQEAEMSQVQVFREKLKSLETVLSALEAHSARFQDLTRQVSLDEDTFKVIQAKNEEARISAELADRNITRISMAQKPTLPVSPAKPRKALLLVISVMAGLLIGLSVCIVAETFDERFSAAEQIPSALGLPVLATFPRIDRSRALTTGLGS